MIRPSVVRRQSLLLLAVCAAALLTACGSDSPSGPDEGTVTFTSTSCSCVAGTIRAFVDGVQVGTLGCNASFSTRVSTGTHTLTAEDNTGSWGPQAVTITRGGTQTFNLNC